MDRKNYMTTGEVANIMHVTKNTLFHYDKIGLFSPEIKLDNEYRYYNMQQLEVLNAILFLKELDISLDEIRSFLENRTPERLEDLFEMEEALITERITRLRDRQRWIKEKKTKLKAANQIDSGEVYMNEYANRRYYVLKQVSGQSSREFTKCLTELVVEYESRNQSICYEIAYVQYGEDIYAGIYSNYQNTALLMPVKPKRMESHVLEVGTYLNVCHAGHWETIGNSYQKLLDYAKENQITLDHIFIETYLVDGLAVKNEEDYKTEISVRILK